ncbi:hypothetical protein [Streptomyces axinellae]|uniref:Glycerophosphoryl diester phosphodiesterase membrane domain-containing protein n=1 Tax=Streptomyces axinellae TaxID=552788 RepID=A0ABN3QVQ9_9ACTN
MNDSPGSASPGPSSSETSSSETSQGAPDDDKERTAPEATPQDRSRTHPATDRTPHNWAAQQPPAVPRQGGPQRWGDAGATRPSSSPRPGAIGGGRNKSWNTNWSQYQQAAKPGVIPLRPLGIAEILDGAMNTMRVHWRGALGISLTVAIITELATTIALHVWFRDDNQLAALAKNDSPSFEDLNHALTGSLGSLSVTALIAMLGSVITTGMLTIVVSRAVLGRQITIAEAWRDSRPQLLRLLGLLILIPLLVSAVVTLCLLPGLLATLAGSANAGLSLLSLGVIGAAVAGTWTWVRLCLSAPALMLEKQSVLTSMRRSAKLVRGSGWRILVIQLFTGLLVLAISFVVQLPTAAIATLLGDGAGSSLITGAGSVIASAIALSLSAGITALLYLDQRIRRESLDLELARAAAAPGHERE